MCMDITLRRATHADIPALVALQESSMRTLGARFYDPQVIECFLAHISTMDVSLIETGTYFVAQSGDVLVGCGGWSSGLPEKHRPIGSAPMPRPVVRAVYVRPISAGAGIGRRIMTEVEGDIAACGHDTATLAAMLGAIPFYRRLGYAGSEPLILHLNEGLEFVALLMAKRLAGSSAMTGEAA